jgi:hypothetical protein
MAYKMVGSTPRDLSSVSPEKAINAAYRLWNSKSISWRLDRNNVDYVIGNGVIVTSEIEGYSKFAQQILE